MNRPALLDGDVSSHGGVHLLRAQALRQTPASGERLPHDDALDPRRERRIAVRLDSGGDVRSSGVLAPRHGTNRRRSQPAERYTGHMTRREALHELVEELTGDEVEALLERLEGGPDARPLGSRAVLGARPYPVLTQIWDNDEDAIFDELRAG